MDGDDEIGDLFGELDIQSEAAAPPPAAEPAEVDVAALVAEVAEDIADGEQTNELPPAQQQDRPKKRRRAQVEDAGEAAEAEAESAATKPKKKKKPKKDKAGPADPAEPAGPVEPDAMPEPVAEPAGPRGLNKDAPWIAGYLIGSSKNSVSMLGLVLEPFDLLRDDLIAFSEGGALPTAFVLSSQTARTKNPMIPHEFRGSVPWTLHQFGILQVYELVGRAMDTLGCLVLCGTPPSITLATTQKIIVQSMGVPPTAAAALATKWKDAGSVFPITNNLVQHDLGRTPLASRIMRSVVLACFRKPAFYALLPFVPAEDILRIGIETLMYMIARHPARVLCPVEVLEFGAPDLGHSPEREIYRLSRTREFQFPPDQFGRLYLACDGDPDMADPLEEFGRAVARLVRQMWRGHMVWAMSDEDLAVWRAVVAPSEDPSLVLHVVRPSRTVGRSADGRVAAAVCWRWYWEYCRKIAGRMRSWTLTVLLAPRRWAQVELFDRLRRDPGLGHPTFVVTSRAERDGLAGYGIDDQDAQLDVDVWTMCLGAPDDETLASFSAIVVVNAHLWPSTMLLCLLDRYAQLAPGRPAILVGTMAEPNAMSGLRWGSAFRELVHVGERAPDMVNIQRLVDEPWSYQPAIVLRHRTGGARPEPVWLAVDWELAARVTSIYRKQAGMPDNAIAKGDILLDKITHDLFTVVSTDDGARADGAIPLYARLARYSFRVLYIGPGGGQQEDFFVRGTNESVSRRWQLAACLPYNAWSGVATPTLGLFAHDTDPSALGPEVTRVVCARVTKTVVLMTLSALDNVQQSPAQARPNMIPLVAGGGAAAAGPAAAAEPAEEPPLDDLRPENPSSMRHGYRSRVCRDVLFDAVMEVRQQEQAAGSLKTPFYIDLQPMDVTP